MNTQKRTHENSITAKQPQSSASACCIKDGFRPKAPLGSSDRRMHPLRRAEHRGTLLRARHAHRISEATSVKHKDGIVEAVEMGVGWTIARFRRFYKRNCETKISNAR